MADNEITLTPEGRDKLIDELAYREGELQKEIIERIKTARGFGDLSENSEYDDAKDEQAKNEARIAEIRRVLSTARVVEEGVVSEVGDGVSVGSKVTVEDERGNRTDFEIVGTTETDSLNRKISNESPIGSALIGSVEGDEVTYVAPSGKQRTFKIIKVTR